MAPEYDEVSRQDLRDMVGDGCSWQIPDVFLDDLVTALRANYQITEREATDAPDEWDPSIPPGGSVCSVCGDPVETVPCRVHQPRAWAEVDS